MDGSPCREVKKTTTTTMAAENPRPRKRAKMDRPTSAVLEQLNNHKEAICEAISILSNRYVVFLRVISCNADAPCSFSDAWCKTERRDEAVRFIDLYDVNPLLQLLNSGSLEDVDENRKRCIQVAFKNLADFLDKSTETKDTMQRCSSIPLKENEWTGLFGTHIAKELSPCKAIKISDAGYEKCTVCVCGCLQELQYGDTSMGSKQAWHGSVDILLGNVALDVNVILCSEDESTGSASIEMKIENLEKHRHRVIAESIVFGCIQHKLTPTIAVSKELFNVYLYDYESDFLFESEEFDLEPPLGYDTIVALWLVMNHSLFGLGISPRFKEVGVFADFKSFIHYKNKQEVYEKEMHLTGCKKVHTLLPPLSKVINQKKKDKRLQVVHR